MAEISKRDRMRMERTETPLRDPALRSGDFGEVDLGYTSALAILEASRCLNCKRPVCIEGCPVGVQIDDFVALVAEGQMVEAAAVILEDNVLPAICGRVCPQERQCEGACVLAKKGRPIAIGALERFVADSELARLREAGSPPSAPPTGHRIAVIGSGPAGLACAADLAKLGHGVTVFEALHEVGGVLTYGIPSFRLPKEIVAAEIDRLCASGVVFETDVLVGASVTLDELLGRDGYDAVFVGTGAGLPRFPGIDGEDLIGVYTANEFLTRVNLMHANDPESRTPVYDLDGRGVVIIGGGNTAVDAARTALRLSAKDVTVVYRRSLDEMPARKEEVLHAEQEGVVIRCLATPTRFVGSHGWLTAVVLQEMRLGSADPDGRAQPLPIPESTETISADVAIIAIGNDPNPILIDASPGLDQTERGTLAVDPVTGATSLPGVFAGGDIATGGATVILALGAGRRAAAGIDEWIRTSRDTSLQDGRRLT